MLPEIIISCNIPGLLYIGDSFLGEITKDTYLSFIGAGSFYLRYTPFSSAKTYGQITARITIEQSIPKFNCPQLHLYNYKDGAYLLELTPICLAGHSLPVCHGYSRIADRFTFSLIEQNNFYAVIEDDTKQLPDGFFPLLLKDSIIIKTSLINDFSLISVQDSSGNMYLFPINEKGFPPPLFLEADECIVRDDIIFITKTTTYGHKVHNSYALKDNNLTLISHSYESSKEPASDIIIDFLECVKFGIEKIALSYLSSDLELSFEELREFMGEYSAFKASPFEKNAYALINKKDNVINRFSFEILRGRINNIQEL